MIWPWQNKESGSKSPSIFRSPFWADGVTGSILVSKTKGERSNRSRPVLAW